MRPFGSGSLGAHADSAPCTVQRVCHSWPSRRRESALPHLEPPRALVHMLEHMWCKEGRSGVRERAAGGGSEADERPEPGTGSWEQFHGLRRRRPPQRAPSTGGAKALAQIGLMLDICGGASQHSTADGTREVIATSRRSAQLGLGSLNEPFQGGTGRFGQCA